ncbi:MULTISPECIES: methyltransferase [Rhodopseudomonas]|uniref:Methyltransferase n=1 Tax=Rhodopseudomonas palustris TaxID=1076 RepID=A0A0D7EPK0_RHOPL|nr:MULTISPECIES: methyltransferase [Rhodopseudomonas]KIZ41387.1 methyltransferase [Rhodopseudomonas palustris]MDF3810217.1 methyltransferase [Rhodopseudomonas sp. BAL398]WOK15703.1 methyltransferase [Rhodopseudomonas sp. BAL398]
MSDSADLTENGFLGGRLRLRQPKTGHRAGHDAMLLAAATVARPGDRVVEFGAGVGAAGLALAMRVNTIDLVLAEIDPVLAELARANAELNDLPAQICVLDVAASADAFAAVRLLPDSADAVLMNPPFHDAARHRASPDEARQIAHVASATTLRSWVHAARRVLKSGGGLTLIWRADNLGEVLAELEHGFGSVAVLPVHGKAERPAIRILVRAVKGGRAPLTLHPGLMLNDAAGRPTAAAQAVLDGRQLLPLALL